MACGKMHDGGFDIIDFYPKKYKARLEICRNLLECTKKLKNVRSSREILSSFFVLSCIFLNTCYIDIHISITYNNNNNKKLAHFFSRFPPISLTTPFSAIKTSLGKKIFFASSYLRIFFPIFKNMSVFQRIILQ